MAKKEETSKYSHILRRPRITEKASVLAEGVNRVSPVYTFEVSADTNKIEIKKAFVEKYNLSPVKINIVNLPPKSISGRRKRGINKGTSSGVKKALVFLKKGEKIDIV